MATFELIPTGGVVTSDRAVLAMARVICLTGETIVISGRADIQFYKKMISRSKRRVIAKKAERRLEYEGNRIV